MIDYQAIYEIQRNKKYFLYNKTDNVIYPLFNRCHVPYIVKLKKKIYNIITNIPNPLFVTLTFSIDVDYKQARQEVSEFLSVIRKRYKRKKVKLFYVCVPEFQRSGRIHFHIVLNSLHAYRHHKHNGKRYFTKSFYKYIMSYFSAWDKGFYSIVPVDSCKGVAKYMTKYISKVMTDYEHIGRLIFYCMRSYTSNARIAKLDIDKSNSTAHKEYFFLSSKSFCYLKSLMIINRRYWGVMFYCYGYFFYDVGRKSFYTKNGYVTNEVCFGAFIK